MFDSHCHIQFPAYDGDRDVVIRRAHEAGVKMVAVGTQFSTSKAAIELAEKYPDEVWATVGYHPNHLNEAWYHDKKEQRDVVREEFDAEAFEERARHPKVVAVGECGLDYYRLAPYDPFGKPRAHTQPFGLAQGRHATNEKEEQKKVFLAQAGIAKEVGKALMIHCRPSKGTDDAYEDLLELFTTNNLQLKTIVHFYVGSPAMTKQLIDAGFYFTFGGVITFSRDYDEQIKMIPFDRILTETDAPYVAPEPYRGTRNEPAYVVEVAKKLAELKTVSVEKMAQQVVENAKEVFKL